MSTFSDPSWSARLRGTAPHAQDRDLWTMAWYTYGARLPYRDTPWDRATQPDLPAGWRRLTDEELGAAGYPVKLFRDSDSGLRALAFTGGPGRTVLAFCGTNDRRDWVTNTDQALGRGGAQYDQAMTLGARARATVGDDLAFTGHSLGGGLAAAAAIATGLTAVTFDAAGLHDRTISEAAALRPIDPRQALDGVQAGQIRAYHTTSDLLTTLQENPDIPVPAAQGVPIALPVAPSSAARGWRTAGLGLGAGLGAAIGGLATGLNPAGARVGAAAGALVGQGLGSGVYGHLYHAVDDGLAALFDPPEPG